MGAFRENTAHKQDDLAKGVVSKPEPLVSMI